MAYPILLITLDFPTVREQNGKKETAILEKQPFVISRSIQEVWLTPAKSKAK